MHSEGWWTGGAIEFKTKMLAAQYAMYLHGVTQSYLSVVLLVSCSVQSTNPYVGRVPVASFVRDDVYLIEYAVQFFFLSSILLLTCTREDEITIVQFTHSHSAMSCHSPLID